MSAAAAAAAAAAAPGGGSGSGSGPGRGRRRGCSPPRRQGGSRRRRALRSLGSLAGRLLRTWARLAGGRRARRAAAAAAEDDEGGFRRAESPAAPGSPRRRQAAARGRGEPGPEPGPRRGAEAAAAAAGTGAGAGRAPGAQGLRNHGNTCFMNAVVQCLSNTAPLAEFLALGRYRARGARAEVTHRLAALVRALWTLDYTPQLSAEFKSVVARHSSQFRGNAQHDALEFLLWLLDRLHEDLGSPSPAPRPRAQHQPGPDESGDAGSAPPAARPPRGQSFVQSHFQAQYRSSLTCPHCRKQSNTFDPFLCVSLPIPLRQTRPLNVTLVFQCKSQRFLRVGLAVPLFSTVAKLREMVAEEGKIPPEQVILAEVSPAGFRRSFSDEEDLSAIAEGDSVYAFQPPLPFGRGSSFRLSGCPLSLPSSPNAAEPEGQRLPPAALSSECLHRGAGGHVLLLLCNTAGAGPQAARFGPPLVMREDRGISWEQLQQCILAKMRYLMRTEVQPQSAGALFRIRVAGGSVACSYLSPQDTRPLCHPAVDRALQLGGPGGPPHVKLTVEWDVSTKERLFGSIQEEVVQDAESVRLQQQAHQQQHSCTLDECFQLYTKEEQLAPDDAWRCPHCKVLQQGTVKLSLWTLPDILIIHLKRFRQVAERRHKLTTLVRFPLRGLDMAPHVAQRGQVPGKQVLGHWAPWKAPLYLPESCQLDYLYDLYAVCNHHGSMQGGHYTAYCCNSLDGRWYSYDDSTVEGVQEDEVSTRSAYILFYQRRNAIPAWSASSSVRGSTSSSLSDHWVSRLGGSSQRESMVSRGSATYPSLPSAPDSPGFPDAAAEKGGFEARPLVRGIQGRSVSMKLSPAKAEPGAAAAKPLPLRWSFASRERAPGASGELVAYLESGRRPRFTHTSIVALRTGAPAAAVAGASSPPEPLCGAESAAGPRDRAGERDQRPTGEMPPGAPAGLGRAGCSKQEAQGGEGGRPGLCSGAGGQAERPQRSGGAARAERSLRRSASLGPGGEGPPARRPPAGPLQRPRYHSASLGRRKAVPESSF